MRHFEKLHTLAIRSDQLLLCLQGSQGDRQEALNIGAYIDSLHKFDTCLVDAASESQSISFEFPPMEKLSSHKKCVSLPVELEKRENPVIFARSAPGLVIRDEKGIERMHVFDAELSGDFSGVERVLDAYFKLIPDQFIQAHGGRKEVQQWVLACLKDQDVTCDYSELLRVLNTPQNDALFDNVDDILQDIRKNRKVEFVFDVKKNQLIFESMFLARYPSENVVFPEPFHVAYALYGTLPDHPTSDSTKFDLYLLHRLYKSDKFQNTSFKRQRMNQFLEKYQWTVLKGSHHDEVSDAFKKKLEAPGEDIDKAFQRICAAKQQLFRLNNHQGEKWKAGLHEGLKHQLQEHRKVGDDDMWKDTCSIRLFSAPLDMYYVLYWKDSAKLTQQDTSELTKLNLLLKVYHEHWPEYSLKNRIKLLQLIKNSAKKCLIPGEVPRRAQYQIINSLRAKIQEEYEYQHFFREYYIREHKEKYKTGHFPFSLNSGTDNLKHHLSAVGLQLHDDDTSLTCIFFPPQQQIGTPSLVHSDNLKVQPFITARDSSQNRTKKEQKKIGKQLNAISHLLFKYVFENIILTEPQRFYEMLNYCATGGESPALNVADRGMHTAVCILSLEVHLTNLDNLSIENQKKVCLLINEIVNDHNDYYTGFIGWFRRFLNPKSFTLGQKLSKLCSKYEFNTIQNTSVSHEWRVQAHVNTIGTRIASLTRRRWYHKIWPTYSVGWRVHLQARFKNEMLERVVKQSDSLEVIDAAIDASLLFTTEEKNEFKAVIQQVNNVDSEQADVIRRVCILFDTFVQASGNMILDIEQTLSSLIDNETTLPYDLRQNLKSFLENLPMQPSPELLKNVPALLLCAAKREHPMEKIRDAICKMEDLGNAREFLINIAVHINTAAARENVFENIAGLTPQTRKNLQRWRDIRLHNMPSKQVDSDNSERELFSTGVPPSPLVSRGQKTRCRAQQTSVLQKISSIFSEPRVCFWSAFSTASPKDECVYSYDRGRAR